MRILLFCLLVEFLFIACSEENPTDFSVYNSTANESSSSVQKIGSSSSNISSSSNDVYSSNLESSSSNLISSSSTIPVSYGELIDERDGQIYKTVKIGEQTWMAENLNFAYSLPTSKRDSSKTNDEKASDELKKYGKGYRWPIAVDSAAIFSKDGYGCGSENSCEVQPYKGIRGICPENWHIPTKSDVENLIDFSKSASENRYWLNKYWLWAANDDSVFKNEMTTKYSDFWSSVESDYKTVLGISLYDEKEIRRSHFPKGVAISVRCVKDEESLIKVEYGELVDERDDQVYKTVKIGAQTWMAENLNYAYLKPSKDQDSSSWCYNNEPDSCAKYGRFYTWDAAVACDSFERSRTDCLIYYKNKNYLFQGLCPNNWHVPSNQEWYELSKFANDFANHLKSKNGWLNDGNGLDVLGFNALPAGEYGIEYKFTEFSEGKYQWTGVGMLTCFWTSTAISTVVPSSSMSSVYDPGSAQSFCLTSENREILYFQPFWEDFLEHTPYDYRLSVRCVKDE